MTKWLTSLSLVVAMAAGVIGTGAHQQEGSCPMGNLPDCCKKAQSSEQSPAVSMARLCCNLNCTEPGSSGSISSSSLSQKFDSGLQPQVAAIVVVPAYLPLTFENPRSHSHAQSKQKYIQHLALLI